MWTIVHGQQVTFQLAAKFHLARSSYVLENKKCSELRVTTLRCSWILLSPWWRHQLETFSAILVLCAGNPPVTKATKGLFKINVHGVALEIIQSSGIWNSHGYFSGNVIIADSLWISIVFRMPCYFRYIVLIIGVSFNNYFIWNAWWWIFIICWIRYISGTPKNIEINVISN